jgi:NAD(P)-dependent dehydrogenase (short-subunit alcohol dehydrogenase family)
MTGLATTPVAGRLADRVAVVTGAGSRGDSDSIGGAIATLFARAGACVVVVDVDEAAAENTVARVRAEGGSAFPAVADLANDDGCRDAVRQALALSGRIDILVNNVGIAGPPAAVAEVSDEEWARIFDLNTGSVLRMCRHVLPVMPAGGSVVNVSSAAVGKPSQATAYSSSKAAVESLTRAIAVQYGPRGIRANTVSPGALWTDMVARIYTEQGIAARRREERRAAAVIDAEGTAWDAAYAALFLAGPESGWITGQVLSVDGGAPLK